MNRNPVTPQQLMEALRTLKSLLKSEILDDTVVNETKVVVKYLEEVKEEMEDNE